MLTKDDDFTFNFINIIEFDHYSSDDIGQCINNNKNSYMSQIKEDYLIILLKRKALKSNQIIALINYIRPNIFRYVA